MKINIRQSDDVEECEITVVCRRFDRELEEIVAAISLSGNIIAGRSGDETHFIPAEEICYFESVDDRTFFYTENATFETSLRLYQLEEKLKNAMFSRISKSTVANLRKLRYIKPGDGGRLTAGLSGGEKLIVSRQYIPEIKKRLGV